SILNLVVAGTEEAIVMVEATASEVSEDAIIDAIQYGHSEIRKIVAAEKELFSKLAITRRPYQAEQRDEALYEEVKRSCEAPLHEAMDTAKYVKQERHGKVAV